MKTKSYYKNHYFIAFYDRDDETLLYMFNNVYEVAKALGVEPTKNNINKISVDIFRSLRRDNHQTNLFRGRCLRVYIIDIRDDKEDIEND